MGILSLPLSKISLKSLPYSNSLKLDKTRDFVYFFTPPFHPSFNPPTKRIFVVSSIGLLLLVLQETISQSGRHGMYIQLYTCVGFIQIFIFHLLSQEHILRSNVSFSFALSHFVWMRERKGREWNFKVGPTIPLFGYSFKGRKEMEQEGKGGSGDPLLTQKIFHPKVGGKWGNKRH